MGVTGRPAKRAGEDLNFIAIPILAALAHRPMNTRELARTMLCSTSSIKKRCKQLEQQGCIVKRVDYKWVPIVAFRMERLPEMPAYPQEKVEPGKATGPLLSEVLGPVKNDREGPQQPSEGESAPDPVPQIGLSIPPDEPTPYKAPKLRAQVSDKALKVSKHFRVPAHLGGKGEAGMGKLGACACGKSTPLRYGVVSVCPLCARGKHDGRSKK